DKEEDLNKIAMHKCFSSVLRFLVKQGSTMKLGNRVNANATLMDIGYHQSSNPISIAIRPCATFNQSHCVHNPFQLPFLKGKFET
ncbi:hypothetical protein, partial [Escherichia coli]|uniref:hypothetical protein n=1 Tax=Escherichia coli TaxID=562 RepID=UPI0032DA7C40